MAQWFVFSNDEVRGPFATEDLQAQAAGGTVDMNGLVWGRALKDWTQLGQWLKLAVDGSAFLHVQTPAEVNWHYAYQGNTKGPMKRDQLIDELKHLPGADSVMLWTKGMKGWAPVFEFYDIADELDINRRQHPRVTISGKVVATSGDAKWEGQLKTLSSGGFGTLGLNHLIPGEKYKIEIHSQELTTSIHVNAQLRYNSEDGFSGFKFESLSSEQRSVIMQSLKIVTPNRRSA